MHRTLYCVLSLGLMTALGCFTACGPSASSSSGGKGTTTTTATAAPDTGPKKCPKLELPRKLLKHKTLTRRIRKLACGLQACFDAASAEVKKRKGYIKLSVTIDRGGRIEAIRLTSRRLPESVTSCVRSKALRWDFDIRDDSFTYGPIKIHFAP